MTRPVIRRMLPLALIVPAAVSPGHANAGAPIRFSVAPRSITVALPPLIQTCTLTGGPIDFIGYRRANNTVYGTFKWGSNLSCAQAMSYMRSFGHITKLPATNIYRGSAGVCGVDSGTALKNQSCRYVAMSGGSYYCDPCNGSWTFNFEWQFRFGPLQYTSVSRLRSNVNYTCTTSINGKFSCVANDAAYPYTL